MAREIKGQGNPDEQGRPQGEFPITDPAKARLSMQGPSGERSLEVTADTPAKEVSDFLRGAPGDEVGQVSTEQRSQSLFTRVGEIPLRVVENIGPQTSISAGILYEFFGILDKVPSTPASLVAAPFVAGGVAGAILGEKWIRRKQ